MNLNGNVRDIRPAKWPRVLLPSFEDVKEDERKSDEFFAKLKASELSGAPQGDVVTVSGGSNSAPISPNATPAAAQLGRNRFDFEI